jgi:hypothetical protein
VDDRILCILGTKDGERVPPCGELYIHERVDADGYRYNATRYLMRGYGYRGEVRKFYVSEDDINWGAGARIRETWG